MPFDTDFIEANVQTTNETDTKDFFENRIFYKSAAFDEVGIQPIDTWEEKPFYGLVDLQHYPVYVSNLQKIVRLEDTEVRCLDFVADAFNAMKTSWVDLQIHGRLSEDSVLLDLEPTKGWRSFLEIYNSYIQAHMENYLSFISQNRLDEKIRNFDDFINLFKIHVNNLKDIPLTRSSVMLSNSMPIISNGLSIEILDYAYDDDLVKYREVISDSNYEFLLIVARKFGFRVDKNIPWRFIADIGSKEMQEFMKNREITGESSKEIKNNLFKNLYSRVFETEIDYWKDSLFLYYNLYVEENPIIRIKQFEQSKRHSALSSKTIVIRRQPIDEQILNLKYNSDFWIKLYIDIRNKETKTFKRFSNLNKFKDRVTSLIKKTQKGLDISKALMYTESRLKQCLKFNYKIAPNLTEEELEQLESEYTSYFYNI